MKILDLLKEPNLISKSYPLGIIASKIRKSNLKNAQEVEASIQLVGLANAFSYKSNPSLQLKMLIRFSELLEIFAEPDETLYEIQNELSSLTGIQI